MKRLLAPLLLAGSLLLGGCNSTDKNLVTVGLRVELTGIERAKDGTIQVAWHIVNPNVAPYLLTSITHRIFLHGTLVGTTTDNKEFAIPAQNSAGKTTQLKPAGPGATQAIADAAAMGRADYRVETSLQLQLYGDQTEQSSLTSSGSVSVTAK